MKKYNVYASGYYSVLLGTYKAESKDAAIEMAESDDDANWYPSLCHYCSGEIELNDLSKTDAFEAND